MSSKWTNKKRVAKILQALKKDYPKTKIALHRKNPLQLLISVILSAQCTDKMVNKVTPALFKKYKTAKDYAKADIKELERYVRSTGFYRNKAKNIKATCKIIAEKYKGKVPNTMPQLLELPGVARKTANIVLGNAFKKVEGIAVDTHVKKASFKLGLSNNHNPDKIEQDLMKILPKREWLKCTYRIIEHGRNCTYNKNKKPNCNVCKFVVR